MGAAGGPSLWSRRLGAAGGAVAVVAAAGRIPAADERRGGECLAAGMRTATAVGVRGGRLGSAAGMRAGAATGR